MRTRRGQLVGKPPSLAPLLAVIALTFGTFWMGSNSTSVPLLQHVALTEENGTSIGAIGLSNAQGDGSRCNSSALGAVRITPQSVSVGPDATQTFTATATSACGVVLTNLTQFAWRLSSSDVGSLGGTSGVSVVYTSCIAPMDGVLRLAATFSGVTLTANASIKIAQGGGGGFHPIPTGLPISQPSTAPEWAGYALMVVLVGAGIGILVWERRTRPKTSRQK